MENIRILCLKPEFRLTKAAVYQGSSMLFLKSIKHNEEELKSYKKICDQHEFRAKAVLEELTNSDIRTDLIRVVIGRGGLLKPIESGIYEVNNRMKEDLMNSPVGTHSVNLGGLIADDLAKMLPNARAYIADPVVVDEMDEIAKITGLPGIKRHSIFHALMQKATARKYAKSIMRKYDELSLIVANLGEGISVSAHLNGRVVDTNQAFDGDGPFSLERAGSLPLIDLVEMCYSGKYTKDELLNILRSEGGMKAHLGTRSLYEIEEMLDNGDRKAEFIFEAMAYQVAKYIASLLPALNGKCDAILLTGQIAHNKQFTDYIINRVGGLVPIQVYPGECVSDALALNALMLIKGEIEPKVYE